MASLVLTLGGATPIVISATKGATDLGLVAWSEPAVLKMNDYAPTVPYLDGDTALSWRRPQTLANFTVAPFKAANEAAADALIAALDAATAGIGYTLTREKNGVSKVWRCDAGSVTPANEVTRIVLRLPHIALWNVSIPVSPILVS